MQSRQTEIEELRHDAGLESARQKALRSEIDDAVRNKNLDGLLAKVDECLAISPADSSLTRLRERLAAREEKLVARMPKSIDEAKTNAKACCFEDAMICLDRIPASLQTVDSKHLRKTFVRLASMQKQSMTHLANAIQSGDKSVCELLLEKCEAYREALEKGAMQDQQFEIRLIECRQILRADEARTQHDEHMQRARFSIKWIALVGSLFAPLVMPKTGSVLLVVLLYVVLGIRSSKASEESVTWVCGCLLYVLFSAVIVVLLLVEWADLYSRRSYSAFSDLGLPFYGPVALIAVIWFAAYLKGPDKK
jgi:hypothetical protein